MPESEDRAQWHALEMDEVFEKLETSSEGLSGDAAAGRLDEMGPNTLEGEEESGPLQVLLRQVHDPIIYLLLIAAAVSFFAGHGADSAVILAVVVLNTLLGFIQEWRAEGALAALREMSAPTATVLRDGEPREIDAHEIVPGDVLVLESGDRTAADARVVKADDLKVDESALTGESEQVSKEPGRHDDDTPVADRKNMVWMSTSITGGRGRAVVVETGMQTEMGSIAGEMRGMERAQTPLQQRLGRMGIYIGAAGITLATIVFLLGIFLRGEELVEMLLFSIAVAVSSIPAGLPAVITVTLALGVRRMADHHAIVRRLPAVETLGSTTVICSDKTGTITRNQMTVTHVHAGGETYLISGVGYQPEGEITEEDETPLEELPGDLEFLLRLGTLNNNSSLEQDEGEWRVDGNPSEGGLLTAAAKAGLERGEVDEKHPRRAELPFSSEHKYMATLHESPDDGSPVIYVKGAPEKVLSFCTHVLVDGERKEFDDEGRKRIDEESERFASEGLRVLAGAYKDAPNADDLNREDAEAELTLVGLWGMLDPPRDESKKAVAAARDAGIKTVMITGDHAVTASAIARSVGISDKGEAISGGEIDGLSQKELAERVLDVRTLARVTPSHKLKVMEALKEHGQVVAMTGDGVNDAPALKGADIGVAMGIAGTEVAKEAADMVLTDDNFATIVHAVEEGRVIYGNLQRVVFFLLGTSLGEILTLTSALLIGLDLPLTTVMILWVNLVTDGVSTVPLGVEPAHGDVLKHPPRDPKAAVLDRGLVGRMAILTPLMAIGTLGLFWYVRNGNGGEENLDYARTVAFTTLAAFQWWQALNARSRSESVFTIGFFRNHWLFLGLTAAVLLQILVVYAPFMQGLFRTTSLAWTDWALIILVSSSIWIVDELRKLTGLFNEPWTAETGEESA